MMKTNLAETLCVFDEQNAASRFSAVGVGLVETRQVGCELLAWVSEKEIAGMFP